MIRIVNIKISVKVKTISLAAVVNILKRKKIWFKEFPNFISFTKKYNFVIFKSTNKDNHVNITKLKRKKDILKSARNLKKILGIKIKAIIVDNLVATAAFNKHLNLKAINNSKKFKTKKYNPESFPGLFLKFKTGTCIIFHSGKIVFIGFKHRRDIFSAFQKMVRKINPV